MKFTDDEIKALEAMLPDMGKLVVEKQLGDKTFNTMQREEILALFAGTIRTFREHFADIVDVPF